MNFMRNKKDERLKFPLFDCERCTMKRFSHTRVLSQGRTTVSTGHRRRSFERCALPVDKFLMELETMNQVKRYNSVGVSVGEEFSKAR